MQNCKIPSPRADKNELLRQATGRIADILRDLCGVPEDVIDAAASGKKREFPCPKCGGTTRFRVLDVERGAVYCSHCCASKEAGSGDVFGAVKWWNDVEFNDACRLLDRYLNGGPPVGASTAPTKRFASPTSSFASAKKEKSANEAPSETLNSTQTPRLAQAAPVSTIPTNAKPVITYFDYRDENGVPCACVQRWDWFDADGKRVKKEFRLGKRDANGKFRSGLNGEKTPPYRLPELLRPDCRVVFIVEGEKCADALQKRVLNVVDKAPESARRQLLDALGLNETPADTRFIASCVGGATGAKRWGEYADILRGKAVVVCADNDEPGRNAARRIAETLLNGGVENVSLLPFETRPDGSEAPEKYDVADWLDDWNATNEKDRNKRVGDFFRWLLGNWEEPEIDDETPELPADRREGSPETARKPLPETDEEIDDETERRIDEATPDFPLDDLPFFIGEYCAAVAKKRNVPPETVAVAALAAVGATIGFRAVLDVPQLERRGITANVSAFVVGQSGAGKSDVLRDAAFPVFDRQRRINAAEWKTRREIAERNAERKRGEPLEEPPFFPTFQLDDATPEALTRDLADNRNNGELSGLLYAVDEGAQFFAVGAYQKSGAAKNVSIYAKLLDGTPPNVSRKGAERIFADAVCLSVLGGIQPGATSNALQEEGLLVEQGLIFRFLWANCPIGSTITDLSPTPTGAKERYRTLFEKIALLRETRFSLAPEAFEVYMEYERETDAAIQRFKKTRADAALSYCRKSRKTALQLAALFRVADWAACEPAATLQGVRLSERADGDAAGTANGFEEFDEYGETDEAETLPASEFVEAINPIIDAETMRRAVAVARWSCESFAAMLRIFKRAAQAPTLLVAPESPLFERVLKAVQRLNESGVKATGNQIRNAANLKSKARGGGKKAVDKILKTLTKQGKVEGDDRRGFRTTDKGRAALEIDANDETETDDLESEASDEGKAA